MRCSERLAAPMSSLWKLQPLTRRHARSRQPSLILGLVRSMARLILIAWVVTFAACALGAPDLSPALGFPRKAEVDPRLRLAASDRVQIARLVAAETSEPINAVSQGENPSKILVTCGKLNLLHPRPWMKGPAFIMQRSGSIWKIGTRVEVNLLPESPTVSPVERYR